MIPANFLVVLKILVSYIDAILCRKCRLPLMPCQKISHPFFVPSRVVSACFHRSHGCFYMAKRQDYLTIGLCRAFSTLFCRFLDIFIINLIVI